MVRIVAVVLIVAPILDVYVLDGRYTQTAGHPEFGIPTFSRASGGRQGLLDPCKELVARGGIKSKNLQEDTGFFGEGRANDSNSSVISSMT